MFALRLSVLLASLCTSVGCACHTCNTQFQYGTQPDYYSGYVPCEQCWQSYSEGYSLYPDRSYMAREYEPCRKEILEDATETSFRIPTDTYPFSVQSGNINPNPTGVNAVKLASAIDDVLTSKMQLSLNEKYTKIVGDRIELVTKSHPVDGTMAHEVIIVTIKSDNVKFEVSMYRMVNTPDGPTHVQPPAGAAKIFSNRLESFLNDQAYLMRQYL